MFDFLQIFTDKITYSLLNLSENSHFWSSLNFFIYDSIKIIILLLIVTQIMSFINIIFPVEKIRNFLSKNKLFGLEYFLASFFWAITPFCSCSSIPLFIWFLRWWIPLWITFSFLITSPLVNEVAIAMFLWIFWLKITLIYVFSWIILWILWWFILWKLKLEKYVADFVWLKKIDNQEFIKDKKNWKQIWILSSQEGIYITKKVLPYVLIWVMIWSIIHWYVPENFFEKYISSDNVFAVPISVILWIPMYANAISVIPIIESLIDKWVPLWTGLAFMMAVVWLSLPEFLILKKIMKTKLLLIFFWLVGFFIILLGYFFNLVL